MHEFTTAQKAALLRLTHRYAPEAHAVVSRGGEDDVTVHSDADAALLDDFAERVVDLVLRDFPDYAGKDENVHADAELVVHMIADILAEHQARSGGD
ncbi:MAG: hypothetical protein ABW321_13635 [Polyangiales bacterium]